jgi:transcription initiation factor IIE alpha subunit
MKRLLVLALINKFGMLRDDAKELAKIIERVFNGKREIPDEEINKEVRALFYELQRERLLKVRREEYKEKGRILRRYYWLLDDKAIRKGARENKQVVEDEGEIYKKISKNSWLLRTSYGS